MSEEFDFTRFMIRALGAICIVGVACKLATALVVAITKLVEVRRFYQLAENALEDGALFQGSAGGEVLFIPHVGKKRHNRPKSTTAGPPQKARATPAAARTALSATSSTL